MNHRLSISRISSFTAIKTPGWRWLTPVVLFSLVFMMAARTPIDSDLWWHLRAGEETWDLARPIMVDTFSFTRGGTAWINHSWLSQVGLYLLYKAEGYLAISAMVALLATLSLVLVYAQMETPSFLRAFVIILAGIVTAPVWSARPQLFSLVLFALVAYLLYLYKWKKIDRLWLIIPIFILWSNMHGGYVLGMLLIASMGVGELLNHLLGRQSKEVMTWRRIAQLGFWLIIGGLVAVINPNGVDMWAIPFKTIGVGVLQDFITEWSSPDFHQLAQQPFLWLFFLTFAAVSLSPQRLDGCDLISVVGFAYLAFLARRNFGPFALIAAPVLARHLYAWFLENQARWQAWCQHWFVREVSRPPARNFINIPLVAILVLLALMKVYLVSKPDIVAKYNEQIFPVQAVSWIKANKPEGNLFNDYNWGGYLVWELRNIPVFVDGRTDLYDDALLAEYLHTLSGEAGWQDTFDRYGVRVVLIKKDTGLARVLEQEVGWSQEYVDDKAVIYVRDS